MKDGRGIFGGLSLGILLAAASALADDTLRPYAPPCTERENVFEFAKRPSVKLIGHDRYEIAFAARGFCDATVSIVDKEGVVVRHLASGVLGRNAPAPFQKNSLEQKIIWNGKVDLGTYHKTPEKLKARVALGLNPVFDKRLGPDDDLWISPMKQLAGIAADESGVYVLINGKYRMHLRRFNHDCTYNSTPFPPPRSAPLEKMEGMTAIEYGPGKKALHAPGMNDTASWGGGTYFPFKPGNALEPGCPVVSGGRLYCVRPAVRNIPSAVHYINIDGTTEAKGLEGHDLEFRVVGGILAASPDGKKMYISGGLLMHKTGHAVWRLDLNEGGKHAPFIGEFETPGRDNAHLNWPKGIDCDTKGRVYVCDFSNNRLQIFAPEGGHLKTVPLRGPRFVNVHRQTGAIYVLHDTRVSGKSVPRISKLKSFDDPKPVSTLDGVDSYLMTLDSWSKKPRVWTATSGHKHYTNNLVVYEEDGKTFRKAWDMGEESRKRFGKGWFLWNGCLDHKVFPDPVREQVTVFGAGVFDLRTGRFLTRLKWPGKIDDIVFDKRGYMHLHFNPGFYTAGVGRWDPDRPRKPAPDPLGTKGTTAVGYTDVPYDYGVYCAGKPMPLHLEGKKQRAGETWDGIITVRDQPGANFFQGGIGCDMSGNVAIVSNIWYVPKMMDQALANAFSGFKDGNEGFARSQAAVYHRSVQDLQKKGLELYFIRPRPGLPLTGSTIWTYEHTGEVRHGPAGILGGMIDEVQMDEDGRLYFAFDKRRLYAGKPFLAGRGEKIGDPENRKFRNPWTGTLIKAPGSGLHVLIDKDKALIPMDENTKPTRLPELDNPFRHQKGWLENFEWIYAGAAVRGQGCRCPKTRFWTDWYRRSFVSEQYRHSIGVVDTSGNLVTHVGQYGNRDSAHGPDISVTHCSFVSATDNHMIYEDECTRVTVLRLEYHSDETVPIELD